MFGGAQEPFELFHVPLFDLLAFFVEPGGGSLPVFFVNRDAVLVA
jgi:hypothetical protein